MNKSNFKLGKETRCIIQRPDGPSKIPCEGPLLHSHTKERSLQTQDIVIGTRCRESMISPPPGLSLSLCFFFSFFCIFSQSHALFAIWVPFQMHTLGVMFFFFNVILSLAFLPPHFASKDSNRGVVKTNACTFSFLLFHVNDFQTRVLVALNKNTHEVEAYMAAAGLCFASSIANAHKLMVHYVPRRPGIWNKYFLPRRSW